MAEPDDRSVRAFVRMLRGRPGSWLQLAGAAVLSFGVGVSKGLTPLAVAVGIALVWACVMYLHFRRVGPEPWTGQRG